MYILSMVAKKFLTEKDIETLEERFKEIFPTREEFQKHRSELFDKLDAILKEVQAGREEQSLVANRVSKHEDRIELLERSNSS